MDNYQKELGHNIRNERRKKGWTQAELGTFMGKDRSLISYYESGKYDPGSRGLKKLARLFGCSINKLLPVTD